MKLKYINILLQDVITFLLRKEADVNAEDVEGTTPIHLAAYRDNVFGAKKLMKSENLNIHVCGNFVSIPFPEFF